MAEGSLVSDFKCPCTQRKKQTTTYGTCRRQIPKMVSRSRPKPEVVLTSTMN